MSEEQNTEEVGGQNPPDPGVDSDEDFDLAPSDDEGDRASRSKMNALLDKIAESLAQVQVMQRQQEDRLERLEALTRELSQARKYGTAGGEDFCPAGPIEVTQEDLVQADAPKPKKHSSRRKAISPLKAVSQDDLHQKRKQEKSARKLAGNSRQGGQRSKKQRDPAEILLPVKNEAEDDL
jgi:hypothetical protein